MSRSVLRPLRKMWLAAPPSVLWGSTMWAWPRPPMFWIVVEYAFAAALVVVALIARKLTKGQP